MGASESAAVTPGVPDAATAERLLAEAAQISPGAWIGHSRVTGWSARILASNVPGLDPSIAYSNGLLHDIGRRESHTMEHVLTGYHYLSGLGYERAARIAITHAFPVKDMHAIYGEWMCSQNEVQFVQDYIDGIEYDDYDRLIQLCDALSSSSGVCIIEQRLVDSALRRGVNERILPRWQAYLDLKRYFDQKIGCNLYSILPGLVDNICGFANNGEGATEEI